MNKKFLAIVVLLSVIPGCFWGPRYRCNPCGQPATTCWEANDMGCQEPTTTCYEANDMTCEQPSTTCYEANDMDYAQDDFTNCYEDMYAPESYQENYQAEPMESTEYDDFNYGDEFGADESLT